MIHLGVHVLVCGNNERAIKFDWNEDGLVHVELKSSNNTIQVKRSDLVRMLRHMELDDKSAREVSLPYIVADDAPLKEPL